jgi:UDP-glucose 4-epimerase
MRYTSLGRAIAAALASQPRVARVVSVHPPERDLPESSALLHHVNADLTRSRDLRDLLFADAALKLGCVVHVAVRNEPEGARRDAPAALVEATRRLLLTAEEHPNVERFVMLGSADVYRIDSSEPILIDEDHPLELSPDAPASLRERVEADLVASARIGVSRVHVAVLRCSPILAPDGHGQLQDYLSSRVCLRPLGFDPMLNVLSIEDAVAAVTAAAHSTARGVFNVPGFDSLPLSELIHETGRVGLALPGPALLPLYGLRALTTGFRFRYALQRKLFHLGAVLDGRKAQHVLGYVPSQGVNLTMHRT